MIIECPYCESKVDGKIVGEHISYSEEEMYPFKAVLLECPVCKQPLLGCQELIQISETQEEWLSGNRLWPHPRNYHSWLIPSIIRESIEEAQKCFDAKAYRACAVMCGRALEGLCKISKTKARTIAGGLRELLERKIIDDRFFLWGEALRNQRNLGAHATDEQITREDARDVLDFAVAICDYIFVLSDKYDKYMERQTRRLKKTD